MTVTDEAPDRTRVTKPLMDYSTLDVTDTGAQIETGRGRRRGGDRFAMLKGTPFEDAVRGSYESNTARSVTVSTQAEAKQVFMLVRMAATKLGLGVSCPKSTDKDAPFPATKDGRVKVTFQGKELRKSGPRKPRQRANESDDAFADRVIAWESETGRKFDSE